jgi:hypothetical protein
MKCIPVFLLGAASMFAADFITGQAARLVIGQQQSFTAADPNSSNNVIGGASGIAYAADTLFVADSNRIGADPSNHRVLIFPNLSGQLPQPTDELQYNSACPVCVGAANIVLGQPDFTTSLEHLAATAANLRLPTAVASDGVRLVVADTNHNRVLIWNKIPKVNNTPADVVVGQPNFTTATVSTGHVPSASTLSGPQGVWIQNGKLYIADTGYNRVLIYNHIPTANGASADVVLGQPDFTTYVEVDLTQQSQNAAANKLLNPVSVTSDGQRVFVTDLGYNRVLIWNSIPTSNGAPADVAVGQPDLISSAPNNAYTVDANGVQTAVLCKISNGVDVNNNNSPTYPTYCNATMQFPRFALSDGTRLFIADGGNDRILEFTRIPTASGASADVILGQVGGSIDQASDAADSVNTPTSLAFDGTNLYVADPFNRRVLVYSVAPTSLPYQAVVNSANQNVYASGSVSLGGTINNGDIVTITIGNAGNNVASVDYTYTVKTTDSIPGVVVALVDAINAGSGDPNVTATADVVDQRVVLQAKASGTLGNNVTYRAAASSNALIAVAAANSSLTGGGNAASVAPGTLVTINGTNLSSTTTSADLSQPQLPTDLGGVEVYINGIRSPLIFVSPTQINAQLPWEFTDTTSVNAYVRSVMSDGSVSVTTPVAVSIVAANPAIFAQPGTSNPAIGIVLHGNSHAVGVVSVDGSIVANDVASISIQDRTYSYTVQATDTLDTVRDALIAKINQDPLVSASPAGVFDRIILQARQAGPDGNTITYAGNSGSGSGTGSVIITPFGPNLCCANVKGAPVTVDNPALPGETIIVYATGVGLPVLTGGNQSLISTGSVYPVGGPITAPAQAMNSIAGGSTADVLQATLKPGSVGLFEVLLHLNAGLSTNQYASLTIAQGFYVSNVVTFPVYNPGAGQ